MEVGPGTGADAEPTAVEEEEDRESGGGGGGGFVEAEVKVVGYVEEVVGGGDGRVVVEGHGEVDVV